MDSTQSRIVAGTGFIAVGTLTFLGFITAEALYPGYSAADQTLSALGAATAPTASRTVFNSAMVAAGLIALVAAYGLHHVYERRPLTAVVVITGTGGLISVGLFPSETGLVHFLAAMIAFVGVGVAALVVAAIVRRPFRYLSAVLGVLELIAFLLYMTLGAANPLGIGGLQRWVAYLALVWAIAFGGFLLPADSRRG